ncbi:hypothetical protein C8R44DRAFT_726842 [Mycena epipterygia]|nr:hypothetical protein C8R44DRAFT_726842 [Mycena epipterygia]
MADAVPADGQEEEGDWDGEYDEEDEEDLDAEAAEVARRLQAELWADISKLSAEVVQPPPVAPEPPHIPPNPKEQAAVLTVRSILASLEHDSLAQSTLAASKIPEFASDSLLDILRNIAASGKIPQGVAMPISRFLVSLAKSEVLFGSLRQSDAPSLQLKRKREEADENERASKRPYTGNHHLHEEVAEAARVISTTITASETLNPPLIASIQPQLHRVFLFAVSSSAAGGPNMNALQEISGLIQVLGVLSGIQIGQAPNAESQNIFTAVYPCLVEGCGKFFARLYSLRAHQRVHTEERPYRCDICPATFARNHDQKRHRQLHDRTAWKCGGCSKVFSRRDAIKRHKTTVGKARPPPDECVNSQIIEVEVAADDGGDKTATKPWTAPGTSAPALLEDSEEGEIEAAVILGIQAQAMTLHTLLQTHVARALGATSGQQALSSSLDPTNGQATLASVIAQAQVAQARRVNEAPPVASAPAAPHSVPTASAPADAAAPTDTASLSMYGLSDEQTKLLEEAIANAATAAQAEAEAQAALEEEEEEYDEDAEYDGNDAPPKTSSIPPPSA